MANNFLVVALLVVAMHACVYGGFRLWKYKTGNHSPKTFNLLLYAFVFVAYLLGVIWMLVVSGK